MIPVEGVVELKRRDIEEYASPLATGSQGHFTEEWTAWAVILKLEYNLKKIKNEICMNLRFQVAQHVAGVKQAYRNVVRIAD